MKTMKKFLDKKAKKDRREARHMSLMAKKFITSYHTAGLDSVLKDISDNIFWYCHNRKDSVQVIFTHTNEEVCVSVGTRFNKCYKISSLAAPEVPFVLFATREYLRRKAEMPLKFKIIQRYPFGSEFEYNC